MLVNNLCHRIIPCLDVANGRTVKGVQFAQLRDAGDPIELALEYERQGADELVVLDITASHENRSTIIDLVKQIAVQLSIPLTVGGGVSSLQDALALLAAGADKVSINSAAVMRPSLLSEIAKVCGSQCCVLAIDARRDKLINERSNDGKTFNWKVLTHGGRKEANLDALKWAKQGVELGAGEILLTSWDQDGTQAGFDLELYRQFSETLSVPIIASGGARDAGSFIDVFIKGKADAALAASIFHDSVSTIRQLKKEISKAGIPIRLC